MTIPNSVKLAREEDVDELVNYLRSPPVELPEAGTPRFLGFPACMQMALGGAPHDAYTWDLGTRAWCKLVALPVISLAVDSGIAAKYPMRPGILLVMTNVEKEEVRRVAASPSVGDALCARLEETVGLTSVATADHARTSLALVYKATMFHTKPRAILTTGCLRDEEPSGTKVTLNALELIQDFARRLDIPCHHVKVSYP
jgi:hypothetical protein